MFSLFLIICAVSFFARQDYRTVNDIHPQVLHEPVQTASADKSKIIFAKDDFQYTLEPLYDYRINAMVVHAMDYTWFSIYKRDSVFPLDLCVIWGDNLKDKTYRNKSLFFRQDFRFCLYNWFGDVDFKGNELSNNHLIIRDKDLEKRLMKLKKGDQVEIKGKLVNVSAKNSGKPGKYDPLAFTMSSSITRNDTGAGACEVLYVEDMKILREGHPIWSALYRFSGFGLIAIIIISVIGFFTELFLSTRRHRSIMNK